MKICSLIVGFWLTLCALQASGSSVAKVRTASVAKPDNLSQSTPIRTAPAFSEGAESKDSKPWSCLPSDVQPDEVVAYNRSGRRNVTVAQKLLEIRARCRRGKVIDAKGREIRFFRPACWGNPPADYLEIRQQETAELAKLRKRYLVIVFGCSLMTQ